MGSVPSGDSSSRWKRRLGVVVVLIVLAIMAAFISFMHTERQAPSAMAPALLPLSWDVLSASVFVLKGSQQVGTGFAVSDSVLATAAHVAQELMNGGGGKAIASDTAETCTFGRADVHISPTYKVQSSFANQYGSDVALIAVSCPEPLKPVTLASASEMQDLTRGMPVDVLSFPPADFLAGAQKPIAFLSTGTIGAPLGSSLFLHTAPVAPGASGAPVFNELYHVVGIVEGGDAVQLVRSGGTSIRVPAGDSVNFALRVDALQDFMHKQGLH